MAKGRGHGSRRGGVGMRAQRHFGRCAQALDGSWLCGWLLRGRTARTAGALSRSAGSARSATALSRTTLSRTTLSRTTLSWSALSATWTTLASRADRTELIIGEFSIGVLVELLQGVCSLSDFNGIDHPVLVGVERFDDRADDPLTAWSAALASRATSLAGSAASASGWLRRWWSSLSKCQDGEGAESQRDEDTWLFHDRVFVRLRPTFKSFGSAALKVKPWVR